MSSACTSGYHECRWSVCECKCHLTKSAILLFKLVAQCDDIWCPYKINISIETSVLQKYPDINQNRYTTIDDLIIKRAIAQRVIGVCACGKPLTRVYYTS